MFPAVHHILHRGSSCSNCSEYRSSFATLVWHCLQTASVVVHHFTLHQLLFITDRCSSQLPIRHHSPILFVIGSQCDPVSSSIILTLNLPPQLRWDCGRIVNCAGIETIAILISATFVNTALSTVNLKGLSNYIVPIALEDCPQCRSVALDDCPRCCSMVLDDRPRCRSVMLDDFPSVVTWC